MTLIYAAAVIGGILLAIGWRIHAHDKAKYGATYCILAGAAGLAFSAIGWWSGLYKMGSGGLGLVVIAVATAACGVDVILQVFMKHQKFKKGKTSWLAAVAGVGLTVLLVNFSSISHSVRTELNSHTVTQVVDQVNKTSKG